ncbi:transglycosylase SLT domain-containing protein, partial [Escherichia coli]
MWRVLLLVTGLLWLPPAGAWCFRQAGERYQIDPLLLQAIAIKESRLNTRAIGYNRNKAGQITSRDYGLMQINERHIPVLR